MTRKTKGSTTIPVFETEAQERAFWKTHDSADLPDWSAAKPSLIKVWLQEKVANG